MTGSVRTRMRRVLLVGGLCAAMAAGAVEAPEIYVSIPSQAWLVQQIAGDTVTVRTLVQPGQDPHTFSITARTATTLSRARIYFTTGVEVETGILRHLTAPPDGPRVVDMARGIAAQQGEAHADEHDGHDHAHHGHDHQHGGRDPHVWLTPPNLVTMAANTVEALNGLLPDNRARYEANLAQFEARMAKLDTELRQTLAPHAGETFYVYHAAFGHLAACYGMRQKALQSGSRSPTPRQLRQLVADARADGVHLILVQPQYDTASARALASAIDGQILLVDPMAADVEANLRSLAQAMGKAVEK